MSFKMVDLRGRLPIHATKRYKTRKLSDIRSGAIHHSLTESGSAEAFAGYHIRTNGWPGIGYHFVIGRDGTVYQCWDLTVVSYHVGNSNKHAVGICMIGDFRSQQPTPEQYAAALDLIRWLQGKLPGIVIKGHSEYPDYSWKSCPIISMDKFRSDLSRGVEMPMTAEERKAMDDLTKQVREQHARIDAQAEALTVATSRILAPDWFVSEFSSGDLNGLISEPTMTKEGWRVLAVALRASK
ncbi:peptidoglycan recognition family protein [Paenibacillus sp. LHD-117]|uniref:peptidoglycan recognition protein family protein n=1 Tax=Paenibacillus sp. LHD-117 TaxID=3071412 RepID=UPI0027E1F0B8|nr:peptidoglycan recognition family protein [Paenibacillus sp. LHD-117]MDQ6418663.1 peptidoglycan recognition family protein [Paenibacillus sp. LHD-117]